MARLLPLVDVLESQLRKNGFNERISAMVTAEARSLSRDPVKHASQQPRVSTSNPPSYAMPEMRSALVPTSDPAQITPGVVVVQSTRVPHTPSTRRKSVIRPTATITGIPRMEEDTEIVLRNPACISRLISSIKMRGQPAEWAVENQIAPRGLATENGGGMVPPQLRGGDGGGQSPQLDVGGMRRKIKNVRKMGMVDPRILILQLSTMALANPVPKIPVTNPKGPKQPASASQDSSNEEEVSETHARTSKYTEIRDLFYSSNTLKELNLI